MRRTGCNIGNESILQTLRERHANLHDHIGLAKRWHQTGEPLGWQIVCFVCIISADLRPRLQCQFFDHHIGLGKFI